MKVFALALILFVVVAVPAQNRRKDITRDSFRTLRGVTSSQLSVSGFYIGMSVAQAKSVLKKSKHLIGDDDVFNGGRIYVYKREANGRKGTSLFYLVWDTSPKLARITVFEDAHLVVVPFFQPLYGKKRVDVNSEFIRRNLGPPDQEAVTLDIPSIEAKTITYRFCSAGLEVSRKIYKQVETSVFALVPIKPLKTCQSSN